MTKIEFRDKVSVIADFLANAGHQYKAGLLSLAEFQRILKEEMDRYPYDWYMADDIDEECAGLTRGEVYEVGETEEWDIVREKRDYCMSLINDVEKWRDEMFETRADSPYFVIKLVGINGLNY